MQNAHLRLGRLEYVRQTEVTNTHVSLHVDRYLGDGEQAHLLSVFGGDAEVGAIRAAIYEEHAFHVTFPDGTSRTVKLGPDANCYNGSVSIGPKRAVRHLVAVSAALQANGSAGATFLIHLDVETKNLAWATLVGLLGIPADPCWGETVLAGMRRDKLIRRVDGIGCNPAILLGTRQELMDRISEARKAGELHFPMQNGPILWPRFDIRKILEMASESARERVHSAAGEVEAEARRAND